MRYLPALILSAFLAVVSGLAQAAGPVSVSPSSARVNGSGTTVLTLNWRVGVTSRTPRAVTVTSARAQLSTGGSIGSSLRRTVQHPGTGLIFVTLTERLVVDRTTAARITQRGTAVLTRSFSDFAGASPVVSVRLQATSGGPLALRHADLVFDDGSRFRVAHAGAPLTARLKLTTNGRGILDGAWEVSGPSGTAGGYRTIGRVRQVLAGSRRITLESPQLPVDRAGVYRARFVPSPGLSRSFTVSVPELRYSITPGVAPAPGKTPVPAPGAALTLSAPPAGAAVTAATLFRWQAVPAASRYRLEIVTAGSGALQQKRIAAVETAQPQVRLKSFTLDRLHRNGPLRWRVSAYDAAGSLLAVSPSRSLNGGPGQLPQPRQGQQP